MPRIILSASRRSDIPAFYMPWFMRQIDQGYFEVDSPYTGKVATVAATVEQVHSIVFWSKDFGPFMEGRCGQQLRRRGFGLFFNFTINSPHPLLEPALPPLSRRLAQLSELCAVFGPQMVQWRFDPVCFWMNAQGEEENNLDRFAAIAEHAAALKIPVCITSFVDPYRKVIRRFKKAGICLAEPDMRRKAALITRMAETLAGLGIELQLCCEKEVLTALQRPAAARAGACIPGPRLAGLYGADISLARDSGQRASAGCGCTVSRDIGSYRHHPCRHNCLYCYANPVNHRQPSNPERGPLP